MFKLIQPKRGQKVKEESKVLKDPTVMIHLPLEFYALKFIYNRFLDENNPKPMKEFSARRIDLKPSEFGVSSSLKQVTCVFLVEQKLLQTGLLKQLTPAFQI